jgi:ribosomal-protein-alanine N-acetyltransferase
MTPMEVRPLTAAASREMSSWRYPGRYATYNLGDVGAMEGSWAVWEGKAVVGHCCFGAAARIPGVEAENGTVDVGYGMRPDLVGQGLGACFVSTILDFAVREFAPQRLRLLVLSWNERSRKVAQRLGFEIVGTVDGTEGEFLILVRAAASFTADRADAPANVAP